MKTPKKNSTKSTNDLLVLSKEQLQSIKGGVSPTDSDVKDAEME